MFADFPRGRLSVIDADALDPGPLADITLASVARPGDQAGPAARTASLTLSAYARKLSRNSAASFVAASS